MEERLQVRGQPDISPSAPGGHGTVMGLLAGMLLSTADASQKSEQAATVRARVPSRGSFQVWLMRLVALSHGSRPWWHRDAWLSIVEMASSLQHSLIHGLQDV